MNEENELEDKITTSLTAKKRFPHKEFIDKREKMKQTEGFQKTR